MFHPSPPCLVPLELTNVNHIKVSFVLWLLVWSVKGEHSRTQRTVQEQREVAIHSSGSPQDSSVGSYQWGNQRQCRPVRWLAPPRNTTCLLAGPAPYCCPLSGWPHPPLPLTQWQEKIGRQQMQTLLSSFALNGNKVVSREICFLIYFQEQFQ